MYSHAKGRPQSTLVEELNLQREINLNLRKKNREMKATLSKKNHLLETIRKRERAQYHDFQKQMKVLKKQTLEQDRKSREDKEAFRRLIWENKKLNEQIVELKLKVVGEETERQNLLQAFHLEVSQLKERMFSPKTGEI